MVLPKIFAAAVLAFAAAYPHIPVTVVEGDVSNDVANAARSYVDGFDHTTSCKITIDRTNFDNAYAAARRERIALREEEFREFILLHELGHCFDGEKAPPGVDATRWQEFLADSYAGLELLASDLSIMKYQRLVKFRNWIGRARNNAAALESVLPYVASQGPPPDPLARLAAAMAVRMVQLSPLLAD